MSETRLAQTCWRLVQQILAHETGALSVEELSYRNPEIERETVDYHLRKLEAQSLTERHSVDGGPNELPSTYWAVTECGVRRLDDLGFYDEVAVLEVADDALERTDRIERIEQFEERPAVDVSP
ncbi:winged-helix domain-containing protein [Halobaculum sp. MBLA0147]|uniref:helix-turn-helix domain-containing protein n=1 Tax=Halobaculum sp. MBLA0147 TaxID=3079934 RepID=UPI00352645A5